MMITRSLVVLAALAIVAGNEPERNAHPAARRDAPGLSSASASEARLAKEAQLPKAAIGFCLEHRDLCTTLLAGLAASTASMVPAPATGPSSLAPPKASPDLPMPPRRRFSFGA